MKPIERFRRLMHRNAYTFTAFFFLGVIVSVSAGLGLAHVLVTTLGQPAAVVVATVILFSSFFWPDFLNGRQKRR